ncbi:SMAD/FHA domain-containing protein [Delphinella strobiligena]|nr:SMAD/FHA domain-containing protein [Delphinella strobiligena]
MAPPDIEGDSYRSRRDEDKGRRSPRDDSRDGDRRRRRSSREDRSRRRDEYEGRGHDRDARHDDRRSRRDDGDKDRRRRRDDGSEDRKRHRRDDDRSRRHTRKRSDSRSASPPPRRRDSRSPPPKRRRPSLSPSPPPRKSRGPLVSQEESFLGGDSAAVTLDKDGKPIEKQKPNFNATGLLAKEANTVAGTNTVLKYHEPPEARKPPSKEQWRIYVFKGKDTVDDIHLFSRSCWLMGRDDKICDYHLQHPSSSKQHAVIQFRYLTKTNEFGEREGKVKPYLLDLESANGTKLNGKRVEGRKYVELLDGDVLAFGESEREYVLMLPLP